MEKSKVNLKGAPIVVAGGYGMGSAENFKMLYDLAAVLGGEVGATCRSWTQAWLNTNVRLVKQEQLFAPNCTLRAVSQDKFNTLPACRKAL